MKKIFGLLLVFCMLFVMVGCEKDEDPINPNPPVPTDQNQTYKIYFYNIKDEVFRAKTVEEGLYEIAVEAPEEWEYKFVGWMVDDELVTAIDVHSDVHVKAVYEKLPSEFDFTVVINQGIQYIKIGETIQLDYTISPEGYPGNVRFFTHDEDIVSIDDNGMITGLKEGSGSVSVMLANSADYLTIVVVDPNRTEVDPTMPEGDPIYTLSFGLLKDEPMILSKGESAQIQLKIESNDPNVLDVVYDNYGSDIIKVSDTGLVTAVKLGVAQVYIESVDGKHGVTQIVYVDGYDLQEHDAKPGHEYGYGEYISTYLELAEYHHGKVTTENGLGQEDLKVVVDSGSEYVEILQNKYLRVIKSDGKVTFHYESHGVSSGKITVKIAQIIN